LYSGGGLNSSDIVSGTQARTSFPEQLGEDLSGEDLVAALNNAHRFGDWHWTSFGDLAKLYAG
jgi:hypothetical protein